MKIALIGAPGSGKTQLGRRVVSALNKPEKQFKLVDDYVDHLIKRTGLAYSHFATYPLNFQVLFERWTAELEAANQGFDTVTCGSIYETTIYCGAHNIRASYGTPEDTIEHIEGRAMMHALSALAYRTVNYDHVFYLPYSPEKLAEKEDDWDVLVDQKLPEVLEGNFQYATVLPSTLPLKEKTKIVTSIVKALRVEQST